MLEAVSGKGQQLRRRGEIPIGILRAEMAKVHREVRQQRLHIEPGPIPQAESFDGKGMLEALQGRCLPTGAWWYA